MRELPTNLAARQHGLLTTDQLLTGGFKPKEIHRAITRGQLTRLSPRLVRLPGAPETKPQRLLAAVLDAGPRSALSHSSALAWWGLPGFLHDEIHVTHARDHAQRRQRLADGVHEVIVLPERHVRVLDAVPVVTPARALFDIAGQREISTKRVERAVDNAWSRHLVSGASLHTMLDDLAQRGRPGIQVMRQILQPRGPNYVPPASGLEARVVQILRESGQRPLRRQVDCGDETGWIGRVDFADDQLPFVLEVQSERFHASLVDQRADADRFMRLEAAGYVVATVSDTEVWHRPDRVVELVRRSRTEARARSLALPA
jgi:very-short-patch-repair endonuclease